MDNNYTPPKSDITAGNTGDVTNTMLHAMSGTKPWVLLIGILTIILAVFLFIGMAGMFAIGSRAGMPGSIVATLGGLYLVMAVVDTALGIYLLKYSSAIGRLMISRDTADLDAALMAQKSFWKLTGIIVLISIIFGVVAIAMRGF